MTKVVLVFDKPENCYECNLCAEEVIYGKTEFVCKGYGSIIESLDGNDWCPLRPLPRKNQGKFFHHDFGENTYVCGWNACLEAITGESNTSNTLETLGKTDKR